MLSLLATSQPVLYGVGSIVPAIPPWNLAGARLPPDIVVREGCCVLAMVLLTS